MTTSFAAELAGAIEACSADGAFVVESAIAGTSSPARLAEMFVAVVQRALLSDPCELLFYRVGSGIVAGFVLGDGRSVVAKAHQRFHSDASLRSQRAVQAKARIAGIGAPEAIAGPIGFGRGLLTIDSFEEPGTSCADLPPGVGPGVRRLLAEALFSIGLLGADRGAEAADGARTDDESLTRLSVCAPGSLYPSPHSPLFDFTATSAGAEWIDEIAADVLRVLRGLGPLPRVVTHADLRAENVRMRPDGRSLAVIWDWDSVESASEAWHVGTTARAHSLDFSLGGGQGTDIGLPTVKDMLGFISDYESTRGVAFTEAERLAVQASAQHALAYSARCEHALESTYGPVRWRPGFRDRLREFSV